MSVGQSNQPYSAPRPRSIPTWGSNQDPNVVMAAWQAQIASNISNAAPQAPPKNFTVTNAVGGLTLNWGQVQGADGYELLKSPNGSFKTDLQVIPIAHNSQTSYFDSLGGSSSTCSYRIRTTSGTPQTPQSARGPESGPIAHTSIATGATTTPTTIRDISSTDKSSSITRLGNYGNFKTPGSPGNSAAASSTGGTSGSASNPSTGSSAYDPAGAAAAAQAAAEAYANATFIPEAVISTVGQIIYGSAPATATVLSIGSTGQVLTVAGGLPVWSTAAGGSGAWSALTGAMTYTQVTPWYNATSTVDSGISRLAAGSLAIGNGTTGDFSGILNLSTLRIGSTTPTDSYPLEMHQPHYPMASFYVHSNTYYDAPDFEFIHSRGTQAAPTAIQTADYLGYLTFGGYDGSAYAPGSQVTSQANTTWTTSNHSAYVAVLGTLLNQTSTTEVFRFCAATTGVDNRNASEINLAILPGFVLEWLSTLSPNGASDTGISRLSAGVIGVGTGAATSTAGSLIMTTATVSSTLYGGVYWSAGNAGVTQAAEAVGTIATTGGIVTTFTAVSDERLKISTSYLGGLEELLGITPIRYRWNAKGQELSGQTGDRDYIGFSAQNVEKSIPEAIQSKKGPEQYLSFDDRPVIAAAVNAIKELAAENKELRKRLDALEAR